MIGGNHHWNLLKRTSNQLQYEEEYSDGRVVDFFTEVKSRQKLTRHDHLSALALQTRSQNLSIEPLIHERFEVKY